MKINTGDVYGIMLLSEEEAERLPEEIRSYSSWWWLRSPGNRPTHAAVVFGGGCVYSHGAPIHWDVSVRPALVLSHNNKDLKSGDIVEVFGRKWYYQEQDAMPFKPTNNYIGIALLMGEPLVGIAFNGDWHKGNSYNGSDIQKWLNNWLEEQRDASYLKEREEIEKGADKEEAWRNEAEGILGRIGLTLDEAITIFIHQVVLRKGIPFEIKK